MNEKDGQIQENDAEEKGGNTHPPVSDVNPEESRKNGPKGTEQGEPSKPLQQVSKWSRFKEWLFRITVAELGMFILTLVIAGSSIYYTKYAKRQWKVMRDQLRELHTSAEVGKNSADSTAKEVELQNRPWVYADIKIAGPFVFDEQGVSTQVSLTYRNDGHSPAIIREMQPELYIGQRRGTISEERSKFCNENSIWQAPKEGITIVPTAKTDAITWSVSVPLNEAREAVAKSLNPGLIGGFVIVCVVYDSTFNDTQHPYYTNTAYQLVSFGPHKKGPGFKFGETLPVGKFGINRFTAATAIR